MTPAPHFTHAAADRQNAERRQRNTRRGEPAMFDVPGRPVMTIGWGHVGAMLLCLVVWCLIFLPVLAL